jgi:hypothetical protein
LTGDDAFVQNPTENFESSPLALRAGEFGKWRQSMKTGAEVQDVLIYSFFYFCEMKRSYLLVNMQKSPEKRFRRKKIAE